VIGHCDVAPWNIVARDGPPAGLIDWEFAGPSIPSSNSPSCAGRTPSSTTASPPNAKSCPRWQIALAS